MSEVELRVQPRPVGRSGAGGGGAGGGGAGDGGGLDESEEGESGEDEEAGGGEARWGAPAAAGGRGRGRGKAPTGPRPPVVGHGPRAKGGLTAIEAARNRERKARVGNHNRKRGADKKLRGTFASGPPPQ